LDSQRLTVDIRESALRPGERDERVFDLEFAPIQLGGQSYQAVLQGDGVVLTVERVSGGYLVSVAVRASVYGPCFRCLKEGRFEASADEQEFVPTNPGDVGESERSPFIDGFFVDVPGFAREALILSLPGKILCREDCPGLCPSCGKDLGEGPCECDLAVDVRWEKLRDLKLPE
jgi:uncharacterized protein